MSSKIKNMDGSPMMQPQQGGHSSMINKLAVIEPDKMKPTKFNILLRIMDESEISTGGILLPESMVDKALMDKTTCVLVCAGEQAFTNPDGKDWENKPQVGDTVITSKYAGNIYRDKNYNLYRHAHDEDVCFVIGDK